MNDCYTSLQLFTSKDNLQNLYGATEKIIVSVLDIDYLKHIPLLKLDVYTYSQQGSMGIISLNTQIKNDGDNLIELQLTPNFCTNFVVFTAVAKQELTQLINWLEIKGAANRYSLIELDPQQEPAKIQTYFWQQMYAKTRHETKAIALRNVTLQRQYLNLRTLHENMQNAFAAVEEYLTQAKLPELQLAFDNQPITKLIQPGNAAQSNSLTIKQLLPVSSRGMAAIDLRVVNTDKNSVGNLIVRLKYCASQTSFAKWQIPYSQLVPGWLSLDLPNIDIGSQRDVELTIDWHTQAGMAPSVILGEIQLIPELQACCNENPIEHSLAFRVWQGLPGTRKVTSPDLAPEDRAIQLGFLGQGAMRRVKEITAQPEDNFDHVQLINNGAKIVTHPRVNGDATVAILPFSFPNQANYLTATVITEHKDADVAEYALAIVSPETDIDKAMPESSAIAHSGWIRVAANTPRQIAVYLPQPPTKNCHIVIAAKLAVNSKPNCAWCRWLNFKLESRSHNPQANQSPIINASADAAQQTVARVQQLNDGKIQVHPWSGIDTVALLCHAVPPNTAQIKAIVCTSNDEADTIEYGMAVIQENDEIQARLAIANPANAIAFTGWQRVLANTPYRLNLELVTPTTSQRHLVLATRIPPQSSHSHGWARWLDLQYIPAPLNSPTTYIATID